MRESECVFARNVCFVSICIVWNIVMWPTIRLVNAPANVITPKGLAESAQSMQSDWLNCKILDKEQCAAMNMWRFTL